MRMQIILSLAGIAPANAFKLLLSSYGPAWQVAGAVQVLENNGQGNTLAVTHTNQDCGAWPTWLDTSLGNGLVTCSDEMDPGHLTMLKLQADGQLSKQSQISTVGGPVFTTYFNNNAAIALAHYSAGAISTFKITKNNTYVPLQNFTINTPAGPVADRQKTAHIHQALLDPTGKYMIFPNLGSDLVQIYSIDASNSELVDHKPLQAKAGYGPRHATFWKPNGSETTFMFLVNELSNKIVSYKVSYPQSGIAFDQVDEVSTFGDRNKSATADAGEIVISPDNKFIVVSNRLSPVNITSGNGTQIQTDLMATFQPGPDGKLKFIELAPSGGLSPRHFSFNKDGSKVAIANFGSRDLAIYERNVQTGKFGKAIATLANAGLGSLTNVLWLEDKDNLAKDSLGA